MISSVQPFEQEFLEVVLQSNKTIPITFIDTHQDEKSIEQTSSCNDNQVYITKSPFRSSDPTLINRNKIIGFQKTGQLLRRIKRQLSTQNLEKSSNKKSSSIPNDKLSTQHSQNNLHQTSSYKLQWQKLQKDQMTQAMIDQYQKQILRLRAQLQDIKQEKKEIKQTLQKQRKFYMTQMYNKQLVIQEFQYQIQNLKCRIQKHINLEYQFQQKIRLLEIQNSECKYQIWNENQGDSNEEGMETIYEENQDICNNSNTARNKSSNKMFMSVDNGFFSNQNKSQDSFELIRLAHQKQILQYEKQLKNMKQFYENRIKIIKRSHTPQKGRSRNSISIMDEYVCNDNISCQSQSYRNPHNLRHLLRDFQANSNSSKKVVDMDCQSIFAIKHFAYPTKNSKHDLRQNIQEEDVFIKQSISQKSYHQLQIQIKDTAIQNQEHQEPYIHQQKPQKTKFQKLKKYFPNFSNQFIKGITIGTITGSFIAYLLNKKLNHSI